MPSIDENRRVWDQDYDWDSAGAEWSAAWGGPDAQWWCTVLPRIHSFLPARRVLEIAPGFGRWSAYLLALSGHIVLVDLSERCIDACRRRFGDRPDVSYHVNDGVSLEMIDDRSIDFAFSFDSLVHADQIVLEGYLEELARSLSDDGVAFIHHSNVGAFRQADGQLPEAIRNAHWRSDQVSAESVRNVCERAGLLCLSQELVNWGTDFLSDAFTLIARSESQWAKPYERRENLGFMDEVARAKDLGSLYCRFVSQQVLDLTPGLPAEPVAELEASRSAAFASRDAALETTERLRGELRSVLESRSWKITRPLRALRRSTRPELGKLDERL